MVVIDIGTEFSDSKSTHLTTSRNRFTTYYFSPTLATVLILRKTTIEATKNSPSNRPGRRPLDLQ